MTDAAIRRTASATIAALLMVVGAATSVAPAHADSDKDKAFIDYLDKKGVPYDSRTEIIRVAKDFCVASTRQGTPSWRPGYRLQNKQGWTQTETVTFVNGAIPTYCPKLWGM